MYAFILFCKNLRDAIEIIIFSEMCLWDLADGRSIEYTKTSLVHTDVQVKTRQSSSTCFCSTSRCVDSRPRVDLDCHCRCAITVGVRSDLCCHLL